MTLEEFDEYKPEFQEILRKAITKAAEEHPEGFFAWLGMR